MASAQPSNATITVDGNQFDVFSAHVGVDTAQDYSGLPALGRPTYSFSCAVNMHDTDNLPFAPLKRLFALSNSNTRDKTWWHELLGEAAPRPPAILTEEDALEHARRYAAEHGYDFERPTSLGLHRQLREASNRAAGFHYVYQFALAPHIPATFIDVAATDGTVLRWATGPR